MIIVMNFQIKPCTDCSSFTAAEFIVGLISSYKTVLLIIAAWQRKPEETVLMHSDEVSQYASHQWVAEGTATTALLPRDFFDL
jgi:hypothetical protein